MHGIDRMAEVSLTFELLLVLVEVDRCAGADNILVEKN